MPTCGRRRQLVVKGFAVPQQILHTGKPDPGLGYVLCSVRPIAHQIVRLQDCILLAEHGLDRGEVLGRVHERLEVRGEFRVDPSYDAAQVRNDILEIR